MLRHLVLYAALACCACKPGLQAERPSDPRIRAASFFTERYAHSRFAKWRIRAVAAGNDCNVLFVSTPHVLDDSLVEAIHYGSGVYEIVEGGVHGFYRAREFRGVVYTDRTKRHWTFGAVTDAEAPELKACR